MQCLPVMLRPRIMMQGCALQSNLLTRRGVGSQGLRISRPARSIRSPLTVRSSGSDVGSAAGGQMEGSSAVSTATKAAFFDFDNTVVKSNIVLPYVVYRLKTLSIPEMFVFIPTMLFKAVLYLLIDQFDRTLMNALFYTNYRGMPSSEKEQMASLLLTSYFRPNLYPAAAQRAKELKRQGYRLVLVSGSLDFLVEPLAKELGFDELLCAKLEERNGSCTGRLASRPVSDMEKARLVKAYAQRTGVDLSACEAYGDSIADVPMLEAVGKAFVVNAGSKLGALANQRGWGQLTWKKP